jgi:NAD(P)H dehydrogenase (quinone)
MNISIIIHSKTGHTYAVAQKLQEKLVAKGHKVALEKITPAGDAHPGVKNLQLETKPEIKTYDGLIFAAPVWAFALSPVMATYLSGISSLKGKKIAAFVTMGFPFAWLGGNRALKQLKQICEAKAGSVMAVDIVGRSGQDEKAVTDTVEKLSGVF